VATIVRDVLDHAQNGSIVVLHLTGGNTAPLTAKALPAVVGGLRARGLRLVKLSELLAAGPS
jgi:peptidoglycan/xylan/chitin deacetylase (PgdA/CDA1 family)